MEWGVAEAKGRLSELIRQASREPQLVYRRHELVAVVVDPVTFERTRPHEEPRRRTLAEAATEARGVLTDERFDLEVPERRDRPTSLDEVA